MKELKAFFWGGEKKKQTENYLPLGKKQNIDYS